MNDDIHIKQVTYTLDVSGWRFRVSEFIGKEQGNEIRWGNWAGGAIQKWQIMRSKVEDDVGRGKFAAEVWCYSEDEEEAARVAHDAIMDRVTALRKTFELVWDHVKGEPYLDRKRGHRD